MSKYDFPKKKDNKAYQTCGVFPWKDLNKIYIKYLEVCLKTKGLQNIFKNSFEKCSIEEIQDAEIYNRNIIYFVLNITINGIDIDKKIYGWTSKQITHFNFTKHPIEIKGGNQTDLKISTPIYLYTLDDLSYFMNRKLEYIYTRERAEYNKMFGVFTKELEKFKTNNPKKYCDNLHMKEVPKTVEDYKEEIKLLNSKCASFTIKLEQQETTYKKELKKFTEIFEKQIKHLEDDKKDLRDEKKILREEKNELKDKLQKLEEKYN
jgi:hypothetical protein